MTPDKRARYARFVVAQMRDIVTGLENGRIRDITVEHAATTEPVDDGYLLRYERNGWHTLTVTWLDPSTRGRIEEEE